MVAVLSSLKGNADLYVKFIDTPQRSHPDDWPVPTTTDYLYKSTAAGDLQDVIKIDLNKDSELTDCFSRFDRKFGTDAECGILFGVFSPASEPKPANYSAPTL